MATIVDRVNKLLALATSPNLNEARNAAYLAAKLIHQHGLEIREGSKDAPPPRHTPPRKTPQAARRPSSKKNARIPAIIESPLGGECAYCGKRYRAGTSIHWSDAEGGIHTSCIDAWIKR